MLPTSGGDGRVPAAARRTPGAALIKPLCLAFAAATAIGCSSVVQRPTAAVTGMAVRDVTAAGFTMAFGVDLTNPNAVALPLAGADYKIAMAGAPVADGKATPDGTLPAHGTTSVTLPVTLTFQQLLAAEQAIVQGGGNVPYALDGGLSFGTGSALFGNVRVPVTYSGTLPVKDVVSDPQAMAQNPAARKLAGDMVGRLFGR